jgi:hypothetical protein
MGKRMIKQLPVKMTDAEKLVKNQQLVKELENKQLLELEKKAFAEKHKAKVSEVDEAISKLAQECRSGKEERPVECVEVPRYTDNMVDIVRDDTGDVVFSRPTTPEERQNGLPFGESRTPAEH